MNATRRFADWCADKNIDALEYVEPFHVAAFIKDLEDELSPPSVKQHLAALRMLFDWLVTGHVIDVNPAHAVRFDEAGANSTVSTDGGKFVFEFPEKKAGEVVHVRINKEGYVVVNDVQLEVTLPIDPDAKPLTVILCPEDEREKWAGLLYRVIIDKATEENYQQKLKALEEKYQADEAKLAAEKAALQKERDQQIAAAENTAEQLAKNQPGQNTELYKQAKRLFLEGKIGEAIKLLGDNDEKRRESVAQAKQAIEQQKQLIDNAVQEWLLKAQLLAIQFDFDGAQEAYKSAIDAAPDDFSANFAYAYFSQNLNRFEKARVAYGHCLEWARKNGKNAELAETLNNLGNLDSDQGRMQEARQEFGEALQIRRELAQKNPETYRPAVAATLNNLGNLDSGQGRMQEARQEYAEALQTSRELAQKNPETYRPDVAGTLNNLGVLDSGQGRMRGQAGICGGAANSP
jgi:tetratricopeptide (TPR) repeat protein